MNQFYQRIAITCLISMAMLASAQSQGLVKEQFSPGKSRMQTNFIRLGELCDSLQSALDLTEIEVVPVRRQGSRTMRRLDDRALRATLTEMFEKLGLDMTVPERFTPMNANVIFAAILEAAAISPPTVETLQAEDIESALATLFGIITDDGRQPLDHWGFKFGTDSSLTDSIHVPFGDYQGFLDTSAVDTGSFSFEKTALARYTTYYYAAWGENQHGIAHGDTLSFTTLPELATGLSISSSNVGANSADLSLSFTDNGGQGPDSVGFWWDTTQFTLDSFNGDSALSASTADPFGHSLTNLTRYTKYYYTGYVSNLAGRSFVQQPDSFVTDPEVPEVAVLWNATAGQLEGTVTDLGGDHGAPLPDSTYVVLGTAADLSDGDTLATTYTSADSSFIALGSAFSLSPGEAYYAAGYAANAAGTGSSNTLDFNTLVASSTDSVAAIVAASATLYGSFEFGASAPSEVGFKWSTSADLSGASDSLVTLAADSTIVLELTGLTGETAYYFTAYATNVEGTSYGDTLTFTTKTAVSQSNLFAAVNAWYADSVAATGTYGHISYWDVSACNYMAELFKDKVNFNSDVSAWDVSGVNNMSRMFKGCTAFDQDLSNWDVSAVQDMTQMFYQCQQFDQDLSAWNVGSVVHFPGCFYDCRSFNSDLSNWDVSSALNMNSMFKDAHVFNQPLANWDVSSVTDIGSMFSSARRFNQPIGQWDVSAVTYMFGVFAYTQDFNQPLGTWDVSGVTNMAEMFSNSRSFAQDLSSWDVSSVQNFKETFRDCNWFTSDLSTWDVSAVTNMEGMFKGDSLFNSAIGNWNTSAVTTMNGMFADTEHFVQDLSNWDVSNVTDFGYMFARCIFDNNLNSWNIGAATDLDGMFYGNKVFNQPLDAWDVSSVTDMKYLFYQASGFNRDLSGWNVGSVQNMREMFYSAAAFNQDIGSWDVSSVVTFEGMFKSDSLFNQNLNGWNVGAATNMNGMFEAAVAFNQPLDAWDLSSVTSLVAMFKDASVFNQDLNSWDVSGVQTMKNMFMAASAFNGNTSAWDVSSVTDMSGLHWGSGFDQDVSAWDVSSVTGTVNFSELSTANLDALYTAWAGLSLSSNVILQIHSNSKYCYAAAARQSIIDNYGWTITDGGSACDPAPSVATEAATNVTTTTADLAGSFANMSTVTDAGFKLSTDSALAGATNYSAGSASPFTLTLTDLTPNTVYHYRAYASDEIGTAQGDTTRNFQTLGLPVVSSIADTAWTDTTATLRGSIDFAVLPAVTATGFKYSAQSDLSGATDVAGDALVDTFTYALTASGPLYYAAYATNALGTTYGDTIQLVGETAIATSAATHVTDTGAKLNAALSTGRNEISATGFIWGYQEDLSDATQVAGNVLDGDFSANLTGLTEGATIYFSSYYTDGTGTTHGDTLSRCLMLCEPVQFDGYTYDVVVIGCDCWFAENLRSDNYNDGTAIPGGLSSSEWASTTEGAQTFYDGDSATYFEDYGRMYNWFAVIESSALCPAGWHVPTWAEWWNLPGWAADLKASESDDPSWNGTNVTGFSATPGGYRYDGAWYGLGSQGRWWTSTISNFGSPMSMVMRSWDNGVTGSTNPISYGLASSVRCRRDSTSAPVTRTAEASSVTQTTATLNGSVTHYGWKEVTETGFEWGLQSNLSDGTIIVGDTLAGDFSADLTGLVLGDTVYFSAYATNAAGTAYGDTLSLVTTDCVPVGFDGYTYNVVEIGDQCWFAENLRSDHYSDGTPIPGGLSSSEWVATTDGAQSAYGADSAQYYPDLGRLYNWYAVNHASGLCPSGWHVPFAVEWENLWSYLGGFWVAGTAMKSSSSDTPPWNGTNTSGFSAVPNGQRKNGSIELPSVIAAFWRADVSEGVAIATSLRSNWVMSATELHTPDVGNAVRCIQDSE